MDFKTTFAVNYDSHHVISIRRWVNKNKHFEHQEVQGLDEREYWLDFSALTENVEASLENPLALVKVTEVVIPIAASSRVTGKDFFRCNRDRR